MLIDLNELIEQNRHAPSAKRDLETAIAISATIKFLQLSVSVYMYIYRHDQTTYH